MMPVDQSLLTSVLTYLATPQTKVGHLDGLCHWELGMVVAVNLWNCLDPRIYCLYYIYLMISTARTWQDNETFSIFAFIFV